MVRTFLFFFINGLLLALSFMSLSDFLFVLIWFLLAFTVFLNEIVFLSFNNFLAWCCVVALLVSYALSFPLCSEDKCWTPLCFALDCWVYFLQTLRPRLVPLLAPQLELAVCINIPHGIHFTSTSGDIFTAWMIPVLMLFISHIQTVDMCNEELETAKASWWPRWKH